MPKRELCELCLDPKRKTLNLEVDNKIRRVHKKCYKEGKKALYEFFDKYGVGNPDFKTNSVGERMIHEWLHRK